MHIGGGHGSGLGYHGAPPVKPVWNVLAGIALLLTAIFLVWLYTLTYEISSLAEVPETLFDPLPPEASEELYHRSDVVQYGLVLFGLLACLFFVIPRRHRPGVFILPAIGVAAACIALSLATYWPCAPDGNEYIPVFGWVVGVFEGDIEIAGPGARCALAFSPGFELARGLAVLLVAFALAVVVFRLARKGFDKWRAASASDVDLVVGLDETTLPLIKALARERDLRRAQEDWIDERPGFLTGRPRSHEVDARAAAYWWWWATGIRRGDVRRRLQRRTCVAVIDVGDTGAHSYELRQLGVKVLSLDPKKRDELEPLVVNWRPWSNNRTVLRRLFAVTPDQQVNLRVFEAAKKALQQRDLDPHVLGLVPRIFVRIDDENEARQWRLENLPGAGGRYFADVITLEGIAAKSIAAKVLRPQDLVPDEVRHLLVVGQSSLWLALLDELAWQQWTRYEFALRHRADVLDRCVCPALRTVTLLGPQARRRAEEWERMRAPWAVLSGELPVLETFEVRAVEEDWETAADVALGQGASVAVFVDTAAGYKQAATRLSLRHPSRGSTPTVLLRSDRTTRWKTPVTREGLQRFALSLVAIDPATGEEVPPPDSVARLAQQQHIIFRGKWPDVRLLSDAEDSDQDDKEWREAFRVRFSGPGGEKVADHDWLDVPEFIREDNIRQHWEILNWFTTNGVGWRRVTQAETEAEGLRTTTIPHGVLDRIAREESERWNELRLRTGWWLSSGARWDSLRVSARIIPWDHKPEPDRDYDRRLVHSVLGRLWAMGLQPLPGEADADQARDYPGAAAARSEGSQ